MKPVRTIYLRWLPAIIFCLAIALYILVTYYQDMIYTAHLRTPFIGGSLFFNELTSSPFGMMQWVGCWLTQFCYHPLLAIAIYVGIWLATYFFADKSFALPVKWVSLQIIPLGCLLLSIVDLGYWIYCMTEYGYWFSHSLGCLLMFLLLFVIKRAIKRYGNIAGVSSLAFILLLYPFLGWYFILLALMMTIMEWQTQKYWLLLCLAPMLWSFVAYDTISTRDLWLSGFPIFEDGGKICDRVSIPFYVLAVSTLLLAVVSSFYKDRQKEEDVKKVTIHSIIATFITSLLVFVGVWQMMFKDYNYLAEMRMSQCAMNEDWAGVLQEAQKQQSPSHSMVLLKNLALVNTGGLGEYGFKFTSNGMDIKNPDGLNIGPIQIAGPIVYANYGKINYATRWSQEFAVCYGYSPYYLMHLARTAKAKGERSVENKYLTLLHSHKYYVNWLPAAYSPLAKEIERTYGNVIDSDNNNMEYYLMDTFSQSYGSDNEIVLELSLFNAMLIRDPERFWNAFVGYAQTIPGKVLPQHYQEAYFLFMEAAPVELPVHVSVSNGMAEAYTSFRRQYDSLSQLGYNKEMIAKALQVNWGGSYWWHYFFGKKMS